ncbi:MAG TPA: hypothetical protein VMX57_08965, partial [Planctomycetota bacterium]|nr:hypothetical protein [Planctomycetota bacterium]
MSVNDVSVLRELAGRVAGIAALPVQDGTVSLWKQLNGLEPARPMVMIDQVCWNEMDVDGDLTLRTEDPFCRDLETRLRRTLYAWKHMPVDMVVEPVMDIPKVIRDTGLGIRTVERVAVTDPANNVVGHFYEDQLADEADVEKIRTPEVTLDERATARVEEQAHTIFDGILEVRMQGRFPVFSPWDTLVTWRGAESLLLDLAVRPEHMHRIISRVTDALLAMLDQLEARGLLGHSQSRIHC